MATIMCVDATLEIQDYDIVIYGGTSAGITAAIQAKKMGKSVVLIEPTTRLGGLTTGGLGQTDIGNKQAIGGLSRKFYQDIRKHYDRETAWQWEKPEHYKDAGQTRTDAQEDSMWTFEPSVALQVFQQWIEEEKIEVIFNERLDRESGVALTRSIPYAISSIRMESGKIFRGKVFIDTTYEGDLMAAAKVSYTVGREANSLHGETLNGSQLAKATQHQLSPDCDPYQEKGNPSSGFLPFIETQPTLPDGIGDHRIQAYCFRMCLTDHPDNRIPFFKPEGYIEQWYELLFRNYEHFDNPEKEIDRRTPWINSAMPNRKTDTNNRAGFSTDFIGQNYAYPEATYAERENIVRLHRLYQQGLLWTLANHPRIPVSIREDVSRWGLCKDEFTEGGGWQEQLYIREARRMVSDLVMTEQHCRGEKIADKNIALAAYGMDSHNARRVVHSDGFVQNEGDIQRPCPKPYPIGLAAILPSRKQCSNLIVPVCLSATHIAFGSIRMEPVFMVLGQSAATIAAIAIEDGVNVQDADYSKIEKQLRLDNQVLD